MKMRIHKVDRESQRYGVRVHALVESRSNLVKPHRVVFIRKPGMHRWLCDCEAQIFIETARRRNCEHIRVVRRRLAR